MEKPRNVPDNYRVNSQSFRLSMIYIVWNMWEYIALLKLWPSKGDCLELLVMIYVCFTETCQRYLAYLKWDKKRDDDDRNEHRKKCRKLNVMREVSSC